MTEIETKQQELEELGLSMKPSHLLMAQSLAAGNTQEQAYRDSKGKGKDGSARASELIRANPSISLFVSLSQQVALLKAQDSLEVTENRILSELAKMGFANAQNYYDSEGNLIPPHKLTPDAAAAITEITTKEFKAGGSDEEGVIIEYKYKINDKKGPLELMGKSLAMFTDKKLIGEDKDNPLTSLMNKIAQEAKAEGPLRGESKS